MANKAHDGRVAGDFLALLGRRPIGYVQIRTLIPRTCLLSNKTIYPFQKAWRKQYFHYFNNQVAFEQWISNEEMLFAKLKGKKL